MANFKDILYKKVKKSQLNNFGIENYDEFRFGPYPNDRNIDKNSTSIFNKKKLNMAIKKALGYNRGFNPKFVDDYVDLHFTKIERICKSISKKDRDLYLTLIAYRLLGYKKVRLPRNNKEYWKALEKSKTLVNPNEVYDPGFLHFLLKKVDLTPIGYDIRFFFTEKGVAIDFLIEQYSYGNKYKNIVSVEKGDNVLDLGACWGDTALYFAHKVGDSGRVFSFEFIPGNIKLFKKNISLNLNLEPRIELVQKPVTNKTGRTVYFKDCGPSSRVSRDPFEDQTGKTETITIDDFVKAKGIERVDFIKMDIEGAEIGALKGAEETIKKFRPKLAIAIYHSMDDFVDIPTWILNIGLDYEIFIDHFSIHTEETICFAKPKK